MSLVNILNSAKSRIGKSKKSLLALALTTAVYAFCHDLNLPENDSTVQTSGNEKQVALVLDDSDSTRDKVQKYLEDKGYHVVQAKTLKQAKQEIQSNPNIVKVVTDMDLTGNAEKGLVSYLSHRTDGVKFINWLSTHQINKHYQNISSVTLHSTTLNQGDTAGLIIRPYAKYIQLRIDEINAQNPETRYNLQPKTAILRK